MSNSEPRIAPLPLDQFDEGVMETIAATMSADSVANPGGIPEFMATMMRHHELFRRKAEVSRKLFAGALPFRLTELALLRTAWLLEGAFVWGHHAIFAKQPCGFSSEDIERITLGSAAEGWDELERAVLAAVEELVEGAAIGDATWEVLARHLDDKQLIELPILVGQMHTVIFTQKALQVRLMPGSLGLAAR